MKGNTRKTSESRLAQGGCIQLREIVIAAAEESGASEQNERSEGRREETKVRRFAKDSEVECNKKRNEICPPCCFQESPFGVEDAGVAHLQAR